MLIGILFAIALTVGGVVLFIVSPRYAYDAQKWAACVVGGFFGIMISIVIVIAMWSNYDPAYSGSSSTNGGYSGSFTNKYGTSTTKCDVSGCNNYIAKSGDTNCCVTHSNKCKNCYCYIDRDAMYCMSCLYSSANKNNSSCHECYVCGDNAYKKYGSYYYCSDCLELVKKYS